jgi:hypothetical protein
MIIKQFKMGIQKNFDLTEMSSQPILTQRDSTVTTLIVIGNICFTILKQTHMSPNADTNECLSPYS